MKILVAYAKFNPHGRAGSDVYLLGLCRELVDLGHEVTVVSTTSASFIPMEAFSLKWLNDYDPEQDEKAGFPVLRFAVDRQVPDFLRKPIAHFLVRQWEREEYRDAKLQSFSTRFPEFTLRQVESRNSIFDRLHAYTIGPNSSSLLSYLSKHVREYDSVIAGYFPFNIPRQASLIAERAGRPCFIAPLWHSEDRHHYFKHLFEALRYSTGVICETRHAKECFERLIPGISCVQAGIGVTPRHLLPPSGEMPSWLRDLKEKRRRILLYVGRKEESKNYRLLVEVMGKLEDPSVTLVMIGRDIDQEPLEHSRVLLKDQVNDDELQWAYHLCDLFLFPSLKESFGIVILEAWAAQRPVIGHGRCAAVSSLIENNVNGLVCETPDEWLAAIRYLLGNPDVCRTLGKGGYDTVLSQYTWKIVGKKASDFIQSHSSNVGT